MLVVDVRMFHASHMLHCPSVLLALSIDDACYCCSGAGPIFKPFDRDFNEHGGHLVDFFSEPARMRARRRDQPVPPVDQWRTPSVAQSVAAKALRKYGEVCDRRARGLGSVQC